MYHAQKEEKTSKGSTQKKKQIRRRNKTKNGSAEKNKKAKKKKSKKVTFGRGNCVQNTSSIWRENFLVNSRRKHQALPLLFPLPTKNPLKMLSLHFSLLNFPSSLKSLHTNIPLGLMVEENIQNQKFNNLLHSFYFTSFILSLCSSTKYNF